MTVSLRDSAAQLELDAELPGHTPDDIEVAVGAITVQICTAPAGGTIPPTNRVARTIQLAGTVYVTRAAVTYEDSTVTITLPKDSAGANPDTAASEG